MMEVKTQLRKDLKTLNSNTKKLTLKEKSENPAESGADSLKFTNSQTQARYNSEENAIYLMNNGILDNLKVARKVLVHEFMHSIGWHHNKINRMYGFHSKLSKDRLSPDMMERLGWSTPTIDEMKRAFQKKTESANYRIFCECGFQAFRNRKSKIVKNPSDYICPNCGEADLKSEELGGQ